MKPLRKRPVLIPAILGFRDLMWLLVAIVIVLLISLLSPSKASAQNLTVQAWDRHTKSGISALPIMQFMPFKMDYIVIL
jgi:hypothetical protein